MVIKNVPLVVYSHYLLEHICSQPSTHISVEHVIDGAAQVFSPTPQYFLASPSVYIHVHTQCFVLCCLVDNLLFFTKF